MIDEILETIITMLLDTIEGFFNALVYPTSKHIITAIYTSFGFLVLSLLAEIIPSITLFVSWQEALTCTIILFIIYGLNSISQNDINKITGSVKAKANQAKSKVEKTVKTTSAKAKAKVGTKKK